MSSSLRRLVISSLAFGFANGNSSECVKGDCSSGKGMWVSGEERYEGEWRGGVYHGLGVRQWQDGSSYSGEWANGYMHGLGAFNASAGSLYEGQWLNSTGHGAGRSKDRVGNRYEGQFANNQYHGFGRSVLADGYTYEGEVSGGYFHGSGVFRGNSKMYEGQFFKNVKHGLGRETEDGFLWGQYVEQGEFLNGYLARTSEIIGAHWGVGAKEAAEAAAAAAKRAREEAAHALQTVEAVLVVKSKVAKIADELNGRAEPEPEVTAKQPAKEEVPDTTAQKISELVGSMIKSQMEQAKPEGGGPAKQYVPKPPKEETVHQDDVGASIPMLAPIKDFLNAECGIKDVGTDVLSQLQQLGVESIADLPLVDDKDLDSVKLPSIKRKKMKKCIANLKEEL